MSEILDDLKKDTSGIGLKIRDIIPSRLSDMDKVRLQENLSPAIDELDRISKNQNVIVPKAKDIFIELLDDISKIRKDIDGLLRADDNAQIAHYKNLLFDDTFVLKDRFRKARISLESLTYRPARITIISILYAAFGIWGLINSIGLTAIVGSIGYYVTLYSRTYGNTVASVFSVFVFILILFLIINVVDFVVGYGLWRMRMWGAKLGIIMASLSILVNLIFLFITFTVPYMGILLGVFFFIAMLPSLAIDIIFIVGIASVWKYFH